MTTNPSSFSRRIRKAIRTSGLGFADKGNLFGLLSREGALEAWVELQRLRERQRDQLAAPSRPAENPGTWAGRRHSATGGITSFGCSEDRGGYGHPAPAFRRANQQPPETPMTRITAHAPCPDCAGTGQVNRHQRCGRCQGKATIRQPVALNDMQEIKAIYARLDQLDAKLARLSMQVNPMAYRP